MVIVVIVVVVTVVIMGTYQQTAHREVSWTRAGTYWCSEEAATSNQLATWSFHLN